MIIFGFDHAVELVDLGEKHYGEALLAGGTFHLVLWMEEDWHYVHRRRRGHSRSRHSVRGGIESAYRGQSLPSKRHPKEIAGFLRSFVPGDETVDSLASRITGGRIGMRPNVAGVKYFKENIEVWMQWIAPEIAEGVQTAIDDNKTGLINRKCIPDGGNQNCIR